MPWQFTCCLGASFSGVNLLLRMTATAFIIPLAVLLRKGDPGQRVVVMILSTTAILMCLTLLATLIYNIINGKDAAITAYRALAKAEMESWFNDDTPTMLWTVGMQQAVCDVLTDSGLTGGTLEHQCNMTVISMVFYGTCVMYMAPTLASDWSASNLNFAWVQLWKSSSQFCSYRFVVSPCVVLCKLKEPKVQVRFKTTRVLSPTTSPIVVNAIIRVM